MNVWLFNYLNVAYRNLILGRRTASSSRALSHIAATQVIIVAWDITTKTGV